MSKDYDVKRGKFIGKVHSLAQEFYFAAPEVLMKILNIYTTSFYGSNLYHLFCKNCTRLFSAWNCAVRLVFKVDNRTHRYLIHTLSQSLHPMVFLSSRFVKFTHSMEHSNKAIVRVLSNIYKYDNRTVLGQNLHQIGKLCKTPINDLTSEVVKTSMKYFEIPQQEKWRESLVEELILIKNNDMELNGFSKEDITDLLFDVCTS